MKRRDVYNIMCIKFCSDIAYKICGYLPRKQAFKSAKLLESKLKFARRDKYHTRHIIYI